MLLWENSVLERKLVRPPKKPDTSKSKCTTLSTSVCEACTDMHMHVLTSGIRNKQCRDSREEWERRPTCTASNWSIGSPRITGPYCSHTQNEREDTQVTVKHPSDPCRVSMRQIMLPTVRHDQELQQLKAVQLLDLRFSAASPMMIFPPLLLVFSTDRAVLRPCSCFPRPWPSLKPYFCMILWATVPLSNQNKSRKYSGFNRS